MTLRAHPDTRFRPPAEKVVQQQVVTLFRHAGLHVDSTSQYRPSRVAEGLPDLLVFGPGIFGFFEVKSYRATGFKPLDRSTWVPNALRPEQEAFRQRCIAAGTSYRWGGLPEAETWLVELGLGTRVGQVFQYRPQAA